LAEVLSSDGLDALEVPNERATEAVLDRSNISWSVEYRKATKRKMSGRYDFQPCSFGGDN
jgi:hypothetical protein